MRVVDTRVQTAARRESCRMTLTWLYCRWLQENLCSIRSHCKGLHQVQCASCNLIGQSKKRRVAKTHVSAEHKTPRPLALRSSFGANYHRNSVARISTTSSADSSSLSKITREVPLSCNGTGQTDTSPLCVVSALLRSSRSSLLCPSRYTQPRYTDGAGSTTHRPVDSTTRRLDDPIQVQICRRWEAFLCECSKYKNLRNNLSC